MGTVTGKVLPQPTRDEIRVETVLQALADPVRLRMVAELANSAEPIPCGHFDVEVGKSTVTHHVRTLREAGVIEVRQVGTARASTLRKDDLDARFPGLLTGVLSGVD
ncbi:ArsR/SmtB family transcription factor [Labedaea rhizosphaerae]|uniref:ArsR family transcriptional regulator n=1 Tax=Labedaea rhizosphaerae TaxID=598644 RepID=A0A4V3D0H6_LABRH|nr:helix-turn-helix transcriptional regulator [Labedaea rhizosphaerae]TDQ05895.1 ArsR family transcriptional regulator [Labedaea rhizosphaerae]